MPYLVPVENAFARNQAVGFGKTFPFEIRFKETDGHFALSVCALRVIDICDILEQNGIDELCVFDVSHNCYYQTGGNVFLTEYAEELNIHYTVIDSNTITLSLTQFVKFLSLIEHYDLHAFGLAKNWTQAQVIDAVINAMEHQHDRGGILLSTLTDIDLYLDSHDDCYMYLETQDQTLLKEIIIRAFQAYAGTILMNGADQSILIGDLPFSVIDSLLADTPTISILPIHTYYSESKLFMPFFAQKFTHIAFGNQNIIGQIIYDPLLASWRIVKGKQALAPPML
jgi:hypothetical protein